MRLDRRRLISKNFAHEKYVPRAAKQVYKISNIRLRVDCEKSAAIKLRGRGWGRGEGRWRGGGVRTNSTIRGQNGASANNLLELNVLLLPANRLKLHSNKLQIRIFLYYPNKKKSCILFFILPRIFFFFPYIRS